MTSRRPNNVISCRSGLPVRVDRRGYLFGDTSILQVGTAIAVYCPVYAPVHVAEQAALLDEASGGRFDLVVGREQPVVAYEVIGRNR
jgi:alkanesulfonate monooxygenase SsuD/methylene tetrahydromethanopterin reductase-like flavin-dependent oxidoreductase (luciferase family)